jgi:VanZ family protein
MNTRKIVTRSSTDLDQLVAQWAPRIVTWNLLLVLVSTLFPFDFSFKNGFSVKEIASSFITSSHLIDRVANVLLFLPLGFGFTGLLQSRRFGVVAKLAIVLIVSAGLSFTVEVLQVFLPSRYPTGYDILNNSIGGFLGSLFFHLWSFKILSYASALIEKIKNCLSIKKLTACFIGYMALTFLISIAWQSPTSLRNWDLTFPLLLGNERTGDRPWQGYVSEVYMTDRAISQEQVARAFSDKRFFDTLGDSLLAEYQLTGKGSYRDRTGHLPDLSWRGKPSDAQTGPGVFVTSSRWLETAAPATAIAQRSRETSQFTLNTTVATADTAQTGPARIVSLSKDPEHRNFTLGQEGAHLVFRLRTPITGENGTYFNLVVPNVFADTNRHHLIITYSGSVLQFYIDKLQNSHSFDLSKMAPKSYKVLYYGLIFIPLGSFLALIATISKGRFIFYIFLMYGGILLPSLLLEGILASESGRSISLENLLLSILITSGTMLIFKVRTPSWFKSGIVS